MHPYFSKQLNMSNTLTPVHINYVPISSIFFVVEGNFSITLDFDFKATVLSYHQVQKTFQKASSSVITTLTPINNFIVSNNQIPAQFQVNTPIKTFQIQNSASLVHQINQISSAKIEIKGNLTLTNHTSQPITAKVFAESIQVNAASNKVSIINSNKVFMAYYASDADQQNNKLTTLDNAIIKVNI